ncbi:MULTISPECIES: hypothetical protein [unclassified Streptomyces]|uniref:hypothetical protein n=1 Tax=unclassified Streptomyces TaxID=2593676 RepID=UPI001660AEE9|nr:MULTISPECIES: hypothetical protein [unclassified Streptomyces]MBD0707382.1 hypothetical protein [Streptomyces sp. CBMA291]MBD0715166.1 hypothetical protein [Streptomyces sp. CBMA370]
MRRHVTIPLVAGLLFALTSCGSYSAEDCRKALASGPITSSRPKECQDIDEEDYKALLADRAIQEGLSKMTDGN